MTAEAARDCLWFLFACVVLLAIAYVVLWLLMEAPRLGVFLAIVAFAFLVRKASRQPTA